MKRSVAERLAAAGTFVVPSRRVAQALRTGHLLAMRAAGHRAWPSPDILPWDAWLLRTAALATGEPGAPERFVLSAEQEQALWGRIIEADGAAPAANRGQFARLAQGAWSVFQHWLAADDGPAGAATLEQAAFRRWRTAFVARCAALSCTDRATLLRDLVLGPPEPLARAIRGCAFHGFDRPAPLLGRLPGMAAGRTASPGPVGPARAFATVEQEHAAAVCWALTEREAAPDVSIAIVCADPRQVAVLAERFDRHLAAAGDPEWVLHARPYRASTHRPLAAHPLVAAALDWLAFARTLACPAAARLVTSPYLGAAAAERGPRARLAAALAAERPAPLGAGTLVAMAGTRGDCVELAVRAQALVDLDRQAPRRQSLTAWMAQAERMLHAAGWPGEQALAPIEQDVLLQWQHTLDTVASLDAVLGSCTYGEALGRLRGALYRRRQIAAAEPAAIEILTLPEAAACAPDRVWVTGLCDTAWPPRPDSSPLLPYRRLRAAGVPGTDAQADLHAALAALATLREGAETLVLSFAAMDGDTVLRASPVLVAPSAVEAGPTVEARWMARGEALAVAPFGADEAPPLAGAAPGGAAILSDQAACPFKAFARHRLAATTATTAVPGLDRPARGSLVHQVLARLWAPPASRAGMAALSPAGRRVRIAAAVDDAIAEMRRRLWRTDSVWRLERSRLLGLVEQWLEVDLARQDFEVVACEEARRVALAGLELRLRVDRIDRLADGSHLIVDYKTGRTTGDGWSGPRPEQPQLPLYAIAEPAPVGGIAFARVRVGDCGWRMAPPHVIADAAGRDADAWAGHLAEWRATLTGLAADFLAGRAPVDPKRGRTTCRQCDLQVLCRVHELVPPGDEAGDE